MIDKLGTCWGVFDTPLHKPNQYLLNTYLLNPMLVKDWIPYSTGRPILDKFSAVRVEAYRIRPSGYQANKVARPLRGRLEGLCNTPLHKPNQYLLNTYLLNPMLVKDGIPYSTDRPILVKFSSLRVGAYRIRPPNGPAGDE